MTRVTTIIPAFNAEAFIGEAIDSALAQTHADQEIIVVDDGSTDGTARILRAYEERIRVLSQENSGPVAARNNAARVARGDWLAFLDADDEWHPRKLEKQLEVANDRVGLVHTERENFGDISRISRYTSDWMPLLEGDLFEELLLGNSLTTSSIIIRRDWYELLNGFDETLEVCEDWDLWLRFAEKGGHAAVVREPITRYRVHSNSMSRNERRMCDGRLNVVRRALNSDRGKGVSERIRRKAIAGAWKCSAWGAMSWKRSVAFLWYLRAAIAWPWDEETYKGILKCMLGRN